MTGRGADKSFTIEISASEQAVRDVLSAIRDWLATLDAPVDLQGTVEIAMAEVLNNIVEHAYPAKTDGRIGIAIMANPTRLSLRIVDAGAAMPGLCLPSGALPAATGDIPDLPEGGFGWFLIHSLTQDLRYTRQAGQNLLCFDIINNQDAAT